MDQRLMELYMELFSINDEIDALPKDNDTAFMILDHRRRALHQEIALHSVRSMEKAFNEYRARVKGK